MEHFDDPVPEEALHVFADYKPLCDGQFTLEPGASLKYENNTDEPITITFSAPDGKVEIG